MELILDGEKVESGLCIEKKGGHVHKRNKEKRQRK